MNPRPGPALPDIDGAACSLGRLASSGCAACVQACPRGALQDDADSLSFDTEACSGCGACAAACPQGAIRLAGSAVPCLDQPATGAAFTTVALVCPLRHPAAASVCLQALGLEALARLWLAGVRRLLALTGDCASCPDGAGLALAGRLAMLNALLDDRGLPSLRIDRADRIPNGLSRLQTGPVVPGSRRAFLGLAASAEPSPREPALARLQSLSGRTAPARTAFSPRIDPTRCSGCDACVRLCPEDALSLIKDETGEMAYSVASSRCTGCKICADVCSSDAMTIASMEPPADPVLLTAFRCRGCGVDVHVPAAAPRSDGGLCPICARTGHHRRLFQVLA